jgi:hypothetical protein
MPRTVPEPDGGVPLTRYEIVGAWLRLWTPPREANVPPVPWRKVAAWLAAIALAVAAFEIFAMPSINDGKKRDAAAERRLEAQRVARTRALLAHTQRLKVARVAPDPAGASAGELRSSRLTVLGLLEGKITADVAARFRAGEVGKPAADTECTAYPRSNARVPAAAKAGGGYSCLAITSEVGRTERTTAVKVGYPFFARIDFAHGRLAWCKVTPRAGEGEVDHERVQVPLPAACEIRG